MLAHVPDLNDFVGGMKLAAAPTGGVITMEFPHLLRLIEDDQFDTIYHEHFSYFSFLTVRGVFAAHGLRLFDVEELPTHGGSLRIYGCHADDGDQAGERPRARAARRASARPGSSDLDTYRDVRRAACERGQARDPASSSSTSRRRASRSPATARRPRATRC